MESFGSQLSTTRYMVIKKIEVSILKVFRKERKTLIDEGNLKRYIVYAFGESKT